MTRGCYNLVTSHLPALIFLHKSNFVGALGYPKCAWYCALIVWHDLWPKPRIILIFHLWILQRIGRPPDWVHILDSHRNLQANQWISVELQRVIHISMAVLTSQLMAKPPNPPNLIEENFDLEKNEADSSHLMLLLHFENLMCSGDWEYPNSGYLIMDLWNEFFEVEYSLL